MTNERLVTQCIISSIHNLILAFGYIIRQGTPMPETPSLKITLNLSIVDPSQTSQHVML